MTLDERFPIKKIAVTIIHKHSNFMVINKKLGERTEVHTGGRTISEIINSSNRSLLLDKEKLSILNAVPAQLETRVIPFIKDYLRVITIVHVAPKYSKI